MEDESHLTGQADSPQGMSKSDDRIWAALAHGSALLFGFGPIVAVILWFTQRKKSAYAAFHALQAMAYQIIFFWAYLTIIPLVMTVLLLVIIVIGVAVSPRSDDPMWIVILPQFVMWGLLLGTFALYGLLALIGVISTLTGREFKYPIVGAWLARYLQYEGPDTASLTGDKEDRVVAAVSHSTCVIPFFGVATPMAVWLTQHERSPFLRLQAMQAAVYQGIGLVAYFLMMGIYMVVMFGFIAVAAGSDLLKQASSGAAAMALLFIPFSCVMLLFALLVPLYHFLGFLGSVRVLRGHDFRYPILGKMVAARMQKAEAK